MANIVRRKRQPPTSIDRFLGLHEDSTGDTSIELGESPEMYNFRITENYKLRKRDGYKQIFDSITASKIDGMWHGSVNNSEKFLFACNGKLYDLNYNTTSATYTQIGTVSSNTVSMFGFDSNVYIQDGTEYYKWDGSNFGTVSGYRPIITISTPPTGGGTLFEGANLLNGERAQKFNVDGTSSKFVLAEQNLMSLEYIKYLGVTVSPTLYTVNLTLGTFSITTTSVSGWTSGNNTLEVGYTKGTVSRQEITKNQYNMMFGGTNDTRVHLWGNTASKNTIYFSELANGVPSAEYFPATNYNAVGSNEYAVTDVVRQYDRQIIFKENETYYASYDSQIDDLGNVQASFPTYPLNQVKGNVPMGQARLIQNNPYTVFSGVQEWVATTVRDERNANYISKRVELSLSDENLKSAITYDFESNGEYWLAIGKNVYIYNYRNNTWYKYILADTPSCFLEVDGYLYFGDTQGKIHKFDSLYRSDNGTVFNSYWEMNFYDFETEWLQKYLDRIWLTLQPESRARIEITWHSDRKGDNNPKAAIYNLASFLNADFNHWSFLTSYNPQPFRFKVKAKKFAYFKIILQNDSASETATVLSINLRTRTGGEVK